MWSMRSWSSSLPILTRPTTSFAPPSHLMAPSPSPASTPRPTLTVQHLASSPILAQSAAPKPTPTTHAPSLKESATPWRTKPSSSTPRPSTSSAVSPMTLSITLALSPTSQPPQPTLRGAASCAAIKATSASTAPRTDGPGIRISKGRETSLYPSSSAPAPTYPLCLTTPCAAVDLPTPDVSPPFPLVFVYDVLVRASYAQSLLVSDCTPDRDFPLHCFISDTLFIAKDAPHHLIISLRSCTLRVCPMSSILLTRFTFRVPHMVQPP